MAQAVGSLLVEIGADVSALIDGSKKGSKALGDLGSNAAELGGKLAKLGAAAAAAGAAMAAALVKSGLSAIDAQAKLARSLGTTIDSLRGLQIASSDAGIGSGELQSALKQLSARLGEAQRGTGEANASFQRLGLSARELAGMDADQRMAAIADRMTSLGLSTTQAADELRKMGIESEKFVGLMLSGGDAIRSARKEVDEYGLSLSAVDAAKVEAANDALSRIGRAFEAIRNKITVALAPLLQELADRFNKLTKANKGFGDQASRAVEIAIKGFAKVADAVHLVNIGLTGLKTVAMGFSAAFWSVLEGLSKGVSALVNSIIDGVNSAVAQLNKLPKVDLPQLDAFTGGALFDGVASAADTARGMLGDLREELAALVSQDWPSERAEEFLEAVRARSQEAAEAIAAAQSGGGSFVSPTGEGQDDRQAAELEKQREALQAKLDQIMEFAMAEDELEIKRHEERLMRLSEGLALELITVEEARATMEALEEEHMRRMADIRKKGMSALEKFTSMSFANQAKTVTEALANMTAGLSQHSKAMFEVNKAAGIANAIISTYQGMAEALKLGWPLGPIAAAAIGAQGFAQVAAIKSQSFSGGGAAPSLAGSTPATPVTPVTGGTPASTGGGTGGSVLTVEGIDEGSFFSGKMVRAFAERLSEHMRDGGTVQFA